MADKREMILARIAAITTGAQANAGIVTCVRNRGLMDNDRRPACVLLDGDEKPYTSTQRRAGRSMPMGPVIMQMVPELYVILKEARPVNENVGLDLNTMRMKLSKAIVEDTELKTLLGANGGINYNGCVTDLKSGSPLTGQMRMDFTYRYVFDPTSA